MLSTMATVTSGIISPNSYGLNPDQIKMATENVDDYARYHSSEPFDSNVNSSDSDQDNYVASPKSELPKRNKRKNFKPRCSNVNYSDNETYNDKTLNTSDYNENNNVNNNVRRRKTLSTRKLVVDTRYSPMDLSKANDSDSNSGSDEFNYANSDNDDEGNENSSENDSKIPQSFSIHNLSKPHVPDFAQHATHLSQEQVVEMRQYAMNTMRELLGIYGLTAEVAESISRQLPMAAFSSGKLFENLTLNPSLKKEEGTPPSQPPTPPSTPLSPKSNDLTPKVSHASSIRNASLSHSSQSSQKLPQPHLAANAQSTPLNLGKNKPQSQSSFYANGMGMGLSTSQSPDFPYSSSELEAIRNKISEDRIQEQKNALSGRVSRQSFVSAVEISAAGSGNTAIGGMVKKVGTMKN